MAARSFHLTMPPSANQMFTNIPGRGRIKTNKYRDWLHDMGKYLIAQKVLPIDGPFAIRIQAVRPDRRKRDLDNIVKPILDLCTIHGLIEDDSLAQWITLEWIRGDKIAGIGVHLVAVTDREQIEIGGEYEKVL